MALRQVLNETAAMQLEPFQASLERSKPRQGGGRPSRLRQPPSRLVAAPLPTLPPSVNGAGFHKMAKNVKRIDGSVDNYPDVPVETIYLGKSSASRSPSASTAHAP